MVRKGGRKRRCRPEGRRYTEAEKGRSGDAREIEVMVVAAGGIEGGVAMGADGVAGEIRGDGEDGTASAAEDGRLVPLGLGPRLDGMIGEGDVAVLAGVEEAATFHFDGDDVEGGAIVKAASLRVEIEAVDRRGIVHGERITRKATGRPRRAYEWREEGKRKRGPTLPRRGRDRARKNRAKEKARPLRSG